MREAWSENEEALKAEEKAGSIIDARCIQHDDVVKEKYHKDTVFINLSVVDDGLRPTTIVIIAVVYLERDTIV